MTKHIDKIFFIFVLIAAAALSAVRFFQYMSLIDFGTGYFLEGAETGGMLLYILMIAAGAVIIVLGIVGNKLRAGTFTVASDGMGSHATQFLGIAEIIAGVVTISPVFISSSDTLSVILMVIACASLVVSGFMELMHIVPPAVNGHLKLVWAVYLFFRGTVVFNSDLTILSHSDTLLELTALLMTMTLAASIARFYARVETKLSRLKEIIFAGLAVTACSVHVIPKIIAYIAGGETTKGMRGINTDVAAGLIISLAYLAVVIFTEKKKEIVPIDIYDVENGKKEKKAS